MDLGTGERFGNGIGERNRVRGTESGPGRRCQVLIFKIVCTKNGTVSPGTFILHAKSVYPLPIQLKVKLHRCYFLYYGIKKMLTIARFFGTLYTDKAIGVAFIYNKKLNLTGDKTMTNTKNTQNKKTTEQQNNTRDALIKTAKKDLRAYESATQKQHDTWSKLFFGLRAVALADTSTTKSKDADAIIKKHCLQAITDVYSVEWVKNNKTRASEYNKILCFAYTMEDTQAKKFFSDNNQKTALALARGKREPATRSEYSKACTYVNSLSKININDIKPTEARDLLKILTVVYKRLDAKVTSLKNMYGVNKQAANQ